MTEPTREAAQDPLARIGRRLIDAEQRRRWRRARRRIAGGALAGVALVAGALVIALPGEQRGAPDTPPAAQRDLRVEFRVAGGGDGAASAARVRARLAAFGFTGAAVRADGDRLTVTLPGARGADAADVRRALAPGRLAFYDWERSVLGSDGRPVAPRLASREPQAVRISQGAGGASQGIPLPAARALAARSGPRTRVVQATGSGRPPAREDPDARFYVLRGVPALTGADVVDPVAGTNRLGQPDVEFRLTADGRRAFHAVTRSVSQRGQALMLPGVEPQSVMQHFAIVLDGRLLSVAAIDPQTLPDGIDGSRGAIIEGGFTSASAQDLARLLGSGALPPLHELSVSGG